MRPPPPSPHRAANSETRGRCVGPAAAGAGAGAGAATGGMRAWSRLEPGRCSALLPRERGAPLMVWDRGTPLRWLSVTSARCSPDGEMAAATQRPSASKSSTISRTSTGSSSSARGELKFVRRRHRRGEGAAEEGGVEARRPHAVALPEAVPRPPRLLAAQALAQRVLEAERRRVDRRVLELLRDRALEDAQFPRRPGAAPHRPRRSGGRRLARRRRRRGVLLQRRHEGGHLQLGALGPPPRVVRGGVRGRDGRVGRRQRRARRRALHPGARTCAQTRRRAWMLCAAGRRRKQVRAGRASAGERARRARLRLRPCRRRPLSTTTTSATRSARAASAA